MGKAQIFGQKVGFGSFWVYFWLAKSGRKWVSAQKSGQKAQKFFKKWAEKFAEKWSFLGKNGLKRVKNGQKWPVFGDFEVIFKSCGQKPIFFLYLM